MVTRALSKRRILAALNPISSTMPSTSVDLIQFPFSNIRSRKIVKPANIFLMRSWAPSATAMPNRPKLPKRAATLNPHSWKTEATPKQTTTNFATFTKNPLMVSCMLGLPKRVIVRSSRIDKGSRIRKIPQKIVKAISERMSRPKTRSNAGDRETTCTEM